MSAQSFHLTENILKRGIIPFPCFKFWSSLRRPIIANEHYYSIINQFPVFKIVQKNPNILIGTCNKRSLYTHILIFNIAQPIIVLFLCLPRIMNRIISQIQKERSCIRLLVHKLYGMTGQFIRHILILIG